MNPLVIPDTPSVYLAVTPVDFRFGINGLCALVQYRLKRNPAENALFVFTNKKRNAIKLLYWYRNGFCLWMKRLEQDRFFWPRQGDTTLTLTVQQLSWLLEGIDISKIRPHQSRSYEFFN